MSFLLSQHPISIILSSSHWQCNGSFPGHFHHSPRHAGAAASLSESPRIIQFALDASPYFGPPDSPAKTGWPGATRNNVHLELQAQARICPSARLSSTSVETSAGSGFGSGVAAAAADAARTELEFAVGRVGVGANEAHLPPQPVLTCSGRPCSDFSQIKTSLNYCPTFPSPPRIMALCNSLPQPA